MPGGNALGRAALSAKKDSDRKKRKPASTDSDSEDSDAVVERLDKRQRHCKRTCKRIAIQKRQSIGRLLRRKAKMINKCKNSPNFETVIRY